MVLDHLIVESLDNNEEKLDVQALLLHGLKALFEDTEEKVIKYDDADIEKLLDRTQIEGTVDKPAEEGALGSFKTARIWANSTAQLEELVEAQEAMLEVDYWEKIIRERMSEAAKLKAIEDQEAGRGRRRASKKVCVPCLFPYAFAYTFRSTTRCLILRNSYVRMVLCPMIRTII
jgi:chromodomain-helicase-DNA-binding protein 4